MDTIWTALLALLLAGGITGAVAAWLGGRRRQLRDHIGVDTLLTNTGPGWCLAHETPQWHTRREECRG